MSKKLSKTYYDLIDFDFYYLNFFASSNLDDFYYYFNDLVDKTGLSDLVNEDLKEVINRIVNGDKAYKAIRSKALMDTIIELWIIKGNYYHKYYYEIIEDMDIDLCLI